jgi:hypothetical protein
LPIAAAVLVGTHWFALGSLPPMTRMIMVMANR